MNEQVIRLALINHQIPQGVFDLWDKPEESPLRISFNRPDFTLANELELVIPGLKGFLPLFDQNGDAVIGYIPSQNCYFRYYYEDGNLGDQAIEVLGVGLDQFTSTVILEYEESGLHELFDDLCNALSFTLGAELKNLLEAEPYSEDAVLSFHESLSKA